MPEINGLHAAIEIRRHQPRQRILMLSMYSDPQYVRNALDAGVNGYILKNAMETDLIAAVRDRRRQADGSSAPSWPTRAPSRARTTPIRRTTGSRG